MQNYLQNKYSMPGKHFYEYAVIRLVPRVEREEFLNVGIILYSKKTAYLKVLYHLDPKRIQPFLGECELEDIESNLAAMGQICEGSPKGGEVAGWEVADRFRWITAQRSTSIQTSRPHNGFSNDLEQTLQRLFNELVL